MPNTRLISFIYPCRSSTIDFRLSRIVWNEQCRIRRQYIVALGEGVVGYHDDGPRFGRIGIDYLQCLFERSVRDAILLDLADIFTCHVVRHAPTVALGIFRCAGVDGYFVHTLTEFFVEVLIFHVVAAIENKVSRLAVHTHIGKGCCSSCTFELTAIDD